MKVRIRTTMAGPGGVYHMGSIVELPEETAKAMIEGGYGEPVEQKKLAVEVAARVMKMEKRRKQHEEEIENV